MNSTQPLSAAVTQNQTVLASFFSNPAAIISFISMVVTIILFLINLCVVRRNNLIEFNRKVNLNYYEITILSAMKEIFKSICQIKKEYYILKSRYNPALSKEELMTICREQITLIDNCIESIETNSIIYISVYSPEAGVKITKKINDFYDNCTEIFSKYSEANLTSRNIDNKTDSMNQFIREIVRDTYNICKSQSP